MSKRRRKPNTWKEQSFDPTMMSDIRKLSKTQKTAYRNALEARQQDLIKQGYKPRRIDYSPQALLAEDMRQRDFISSTKLVSNIPKSEMYNDIYDENGNIRSRQAAQTRIFTDGSPDKSVGLSPDDKWTILRRLATQDYRLNVDRAYASDTLKDIADIIEQEIREGSGRSYADIADEMLEELQSNQLENARWNARLKPMKSNSEDIESKLFREDYLKTGTVQMHGITKAKSRLRKTTLDTFTPLVANPFDFVSSSQLDFYMKGRK